MGFYKYQVLWKKNLKIKSDKNFICWHCLFWFDLPIRKEKGKFKQGKILSTKVFVFYTYSSGRNRIFTKSCHHQTCNSCEQLPERVECYDFQNHVVSWTSHTKNSWMVSRRDGWYWYVVTKKHSLLGLTSAWCQVLVVYSSHCSHLLHKSIYSTPATLVCYFGC